MTARFLQDVVDAAKRHHTLAAGYRMAGDRDLAAAASHAATALDDAAAAVDLYLAAAAEADSFAREA